MQHLTSLQFDLIILATLTIGMAIGVFFTSWWYTKPNKENKDEKIAFDETNIYNN